MSLIEDIKWGTAITNADDILNDIQGQVADDQTLGELEDMAVELDKRGYGEVAARIREAISECVSLNATIEDALDYLAGVE